MFDESQITRDTLRKATHLLTTTAKCDVRIDHRSKNSSPTQS